MPTRGWTAGLVGRRDALLLVLAAAGVPYTAIAHLRRRDLVVDDNRCLAITLPTTVVRIPAAQADPRSCPVAVYLRWARLRAYFDRYPSTLALAEALRVAEPLNAESVERYQPLPEPSRERRDPLLPNIDRWGQFGTPRGSRRESWGVDADSAVRIVRSHLAGEAVPRYLEGKPGSADSLVVADGDDQDRGVRSLPPVRRDGAELRRRDTETSRRSVSRDSHFDVSSALLHDRAQDGYPGPCIGPAMDRSERSESSTAPSHEPRGVSSAVVHDVAELWAAPGSRRSRAH